MEELQLAESSVFIFSPVLDVSCLEHQTQAQLSDPVHTKGLPAPLGLATGQKAALLCFRTGGFGTRLDHLTGFPELLNLQTTYHGTHS